MALALDQVSFTNTGLLAAEKVAESNSDTGVRSVTFVAADSVAVASTTLHYSLDDGQSFQALAMTTNRADSGQMVIHGQLPAQPLGTDVRYYVEVAHANGYHSRMPVDAPQSYYRYQVDDRPSVLIDDFGGSRLHNRLGGNSGLFNDPTNGGLLTAYQVAQQLRLDYAVDESDQYAGYYTELQNLNATAYTTLDLMVRGDFGGEQLHIGLRDQHGYEPRLSVGDFLSGGLQQDWQWIQIPLASFGSQLDLAALQSLSLTFYNSYVPMNGRIYVSEIRLTTLVAPSVIDSFDDRDMQKNSQGLGYWISAPNSTLTATPISGDAIAGRGAALQLDYSVGANGYALWHSELDKLNVSADAILSLWVRGESEAVPASFYLTDGNSRARVALIDYVTLTEQWQLVEIPLTAFTNQGLDHTKLTGFEVAFEFGVGSGTLVIDNIQMGRVGTPQVNRRTLHLLDSDNKPLALHFPTGGRWSTSSDVPWLHSVGAEAGSGTLIVQSWPWGLPVGEYTGTLTVESSAAGDSPQSREQISVTLTVTQPQIATSQIFLPVVSR